MRWWFCIYCGMITSVSLVNIVTIHSYKIFFVMRSFKICSPSNFQAYNTVFKFFKFIYLWREGEREGEKHWCAIETLMGYLSHTPNQGPGPQPRQVPWPGIEPVTFQFSGQCSAHWATPARAVVLAGVTVLHTTSPGLVHSETGSLYLRVLFCYWLQVQFCYNTRAYLYYSIFRNCWRLS